MRDVDSGGKCPVVGSHRAVVVIRETLGSGIEGLVVAVGVDNHEVAHRGGVESQRYRHLVGERRGEAYYERTVDHV